MQVKVTKRYSHGFQADGNFTWAKGDVIGSASDSTFFLGQQAVTTDIYNYNNNKQINQYVRPLAMVITFYLHHAEVRIVQPRDEGSVPCDA